MNIKTPTNSDVFVAFDLITVFAYTGDRQTPAAEFLLNALNNNSRGTTTTIAHRRTTKAAIFLAQNGAKCNNNASTRASERVTNRYGTYDRKAGFQISRNR